MVSEKEDPAPTNKSRSVTPIHLLKFKTPFSVSDAPNTDESKQTNFKRGVLVIKQPVTTIQSIIKVVKTNRITKDNRFLSKRSPYSIIHHSQQGKQKGHNRIISKTEKY